MSDDVSAYYNEHDQAVRDQPRPKNAARVVLCALVIVASCTNDRALAPHPELPCTNAIRPAYYSLVSQGTPLPEIYTNHYMVPHHYADTSAGAGIFGGSIRLHLDQCTLASDSVEFYTGQGLLIVPAEAPNDAKD